MDTLQTQKIVITEDKTANSIEMSIRDEDHTLGNAIVSELQTTEGIAFAAYKIPHPLQNILKVKVTAEQGQERPVEFVKACLDSLIRDCDTMLSRVYR
ncbi:DNA-directed RNA polymerase II subunit RPB11 [Nematocida major]|uniref:DNA-directed RNA polymerase II subunit RPB11 n=1 Tax=Nematocida major TaxID=1912982 RepID=UPI002008E7F8|nr:DNA-directed RNA polymerase II subunit RPB11 [Nematocida major]KAH9385386.1 DNA-directed RNA polymerase II subunit RPB11 [Nematocida major]